MDATGFILQATYRIHAGVPVIYLFGRLESGETFLVRDHRQRPHFYVRQEDARRAEALDGIALEASAARTFSGDAVCRVTVPTPSDAPPARERLHGLGIDTFEADVRFAMRYLIDRGIRGGCRIRGAASRGEGVGWVFDDPEVGAA